MTMNQLYHCFPRPEDRAILSLYPASSWKQWLEVHDTADTEFSLCLLSLVLVPLLFRMLTRILNSLGYSIARTVDQLARIVRRGFRLRPRRRARPQHSALTAAQVIRCHRPSDTLVSLESVCTVNSSARIRDSGPGFAPRAPRRPSTPDPAQSAVALSRRGC